MSGGFMFAFGDEPAHMDNNPSSTEVQPFTPPNPLERGQYSQGSTMWTTTEAEDNTGGGGGSLRQQGRTISSIISEPPGSVDRQDSTGLMVGGVALCSKQRSTDASSLRDVQFMGGGTSSSQQHFLSPTTSSISSNPLDSIGSPSDATGFNNASQQHHRPTTTTAAGGGGGTVSNTPKPKQDLVLRSLDIPTAVANYRDNKHLTEKVNEVIMKIKAPDGGMLMRHRVPPHITSLEGGVDENDLNNGGAALQGSSSSNSAAKLRQQGRDIVQGSYLGGLKIWSCAPHLCDFLVYCVYNTPEKTSSLSSSSSSAMACAAEDPASPNEALRHGFLRQTVVDCLRGPVLELGCGHGLPGITTLRLGAEDVTFLDFNQEVIDEVTIPNIALNAKVDEDERAKTSSSLELLFSQQRNKKKKTPAPKKGSAAAVAGAKKFTLSSASNTSASNAGPSSASIPTTSETQTPPLQQRRPPVELATYDINPEAIVRTCSGDWTHFSPPRFFERTWSEIEGTSARSLPPNAQFNLTISSPRKAKPPTTSTTTNDENRSDPIRLLQGNTGGVRQFSDLSLDFGFEGDGGGDNSSPVRPSGVQQHQLYSMIIGSDVTYDDSTTFSVLMAISRLLEPRTGVAFISTKPFYFGTGGGWAFVQETIRKWSASLNGMTATVVEHSKSGQGMERMVIMIQVGT